MALLYPNASAGPSKRDEDINAARSLLSFASVNRNTTEKLHLELSNTLTARPKNFSPTSLAPPELTSSHQDLEAAEAIMGLTFSGAQAAGPFHASQSFYADNFTLPPINTISSYTITEADTDASEYSFAHQHSVLAPYSPKTRARTGRSSSAPRELFEPPFEIIVLPPTSRSSSPYMRKPVMGKGAIIGEVLDDYIFNNELLWRGEKSLLPPKPRVRKGRKAPVAKVEKKAPAPRKGKASATEKGTKAPAVEEQEYLTVPIASKRKRAGSEGKIRAKQVVDRGLPGEPTMVEASGVAEEELGGRPRRARRATKKVGGLR